MTGATVILGAIRPNEWELPLFVHVLGALAFTGALALAAVYLFATWRSGSAASLRLALRSIALGVFPAFLVFRGSAEWIADKEGYADLDDPPDWIDIGYMVSDTGLLLLVIASLLGYLAMRKARAGGEGPSALVKVAAVLIALLLVMNVVAIWAMTTKPS